VRIATVSSQILNQLNVFYFSTQELRFMLQIPWTHPTSASLTLTVMEYIPDIAVIIDVPV
jgi:hypothetical protein